MALTTLLDSDISIQNGTRNHGPFTIPDGANLVDVRLSRSTTPTPSYWPNAATTLRYTIECSYDGGVNWNPEASTGATPIAGGIQTRTGGGEVTHVRIALQGLPEVTGRRVRVQTIVTNGPLATHLLVQTE